MTPETIWHLNTSLIGRRVVVYPSLESTNTLAANLKPEESNHGLVILARQQTAGRGQHGRTWECPPNMGVLMSVYLLPPEHLKKPVALTAWAAVSICEAIFQLTGLDTSIKWPNDVLVQSKKICGILIEQGRGTVVGLGINVNQSAESFHKPGLAHGASLYSLTNLPWICDEVAREVIVHLDREYQKLEEGSMASLESRWKSYLELHDKPVVVESGDAFFEGTVVKLTFNELVLTREGAKTSFRPEAVKHVTRV